MKIAVMGAGAVGCFYGGMLARAGHEVVLIGRPSHVESIQKQGLLLETLAFTERVAASAGSDPALVHDAALVLCCVKSNDTAAAATAMAPFLSGDAVVLSLQNGVDNAQQLSTLLGREVFPAVVYVAAEMGGAGHVRHHGRGELLIGPSPHAERLVTLFATAGVSVQISDNVSGALWTKLIINCVINALSAITRLPYGAMSWPNVKPWPRPTASICRTPFGQASRASCARCRRNAHPPHRMWNAGSAARSII